jgi:hypothetical protein
MEYTILKLLSQASKVKYHMSSKFVEPRPKIMMMRIMMVGNKCVLESFCCVWGNQWKRRGDERRGYRVVKRIEVHYIYTYEDSIMNPTKTV